MAKAGSDRHWERWLAALIAAGLAWAIVKLAQTTEALEQRSIRNEMRSIDNKEEVDRLRDKEE